MTRYEPVVGLEVHAQIHTASKLFCSCPVVEDTGSLPPNTYVCPVCTAMPGALPVLNRRAVELTILVGLALQCEIPPVCSFARKSYFYPDLPKGYQISQYALPLATGGSLEIETGLGPKRVAIDNVHLEEDTAKLHHVANRSLVDFNRAGVPLIEVVSAPDMRSADEVRAFATRLRDALVCLGVNPGDMEKGVMRFEASVSVRPVGSNLLNPRHEIKNINSFRALARAVAYEIEHQIEVLEAGGSVVQETMGWDEVRGVTYVQRSKEQVHDYRYFAEPDLPPLDVGREWVDGLRARLPELPHARRARFVSEYGLGVHEAGLLVADGSIADFYEAAVALGGAAPQTVCNWVVGDLFRLMKRTEGVGGAVPVTPRVLVELIALVDQGTISLNAGREVLEEMVASGRQAREIVAEDGWAQVSDPVLLRPVVERVLDAHPEQVAQAVGGARPLLNWLIGQVMKSTRGRANPRVVTALLGEALAARRDES
jgi:aspartyl-tRNA(Asn)/glutamyl-tRNA(Gln) amidotransferase subunit B